MQKNDVSTGFICKELALMFTTPCNFSPMDEEMVERYGDEWCENNCFPENYPKCWELYFEMMAERQRG